MVLPPSVDCQEATVVRTRRRSLTGTETFSKQSSTIGWRVGIQLNTPVGMRQPGRFTFSPNVKKTSCAFIISTRTRDSSSMVPARYSGTEACVYIGSLSMNAVLFAAKYSSLIQQDAETCIKRSAVRQNSTTSAQLRP